MIGLYAGDIVIENPPYPFRIVRRGAVRSSSERDTRNSATSVPSVDRYVCCATANAVASGPPGRTLHGVIVVGVQRKSVDGRAKPVNANTASSDSRLVAT